MKLRPASETIYSSELTLEVTACLCKAKPESEMSLPVSVGQHVHILTAGLPR